MSDSFFISVSLSHPTYRYPDPACISCRCSFTHSFNGDDPVMIVCLVVTEQRFRFRLRVLYLFHQLAVLRN